MKRKILQPLLVLLFLAVLGGTFYFAPFLLTLLGNASYRFVALFLFFILSSNILAKIAHSYITL